MVGSTVLSAVIQAVVMAIGLAITLVAIALWFSGRMSDISSNLDSMDSSVSIVEQAVRDVDLKEIEKTVLRLEYAVDAEVEGDNSVYYELPESGIGVTVSLTAVPSDDLIDPFRKVSPDELEDTETQSQLAEYVFKKKSEGEDKEEREPEEEMLEEEEIPDDMSVVRTPSVVSDKYEGEITYVTLEFDERIRSKSVTQAISNDSDLEELELELFGYECGFKALSPIEMQFSIPSSDYEEVSEWIPMVLDKIDKYHCEFEEEAEKFDSAIEASLSGEGSNDSF